MFDRRSGVGKMTIEKIAAGTGRVDAHCAHPSTETKNLS
jgi:hypothetical protein